MQIAPNLARILRRSPRVCVELCLSMEIMDLVESELDVAIRMAEAIEPGFVAIHLAPYRRVFCAAPSCIATRGAPMQLQDLLNHNCLVSRGAWSNSD